MKPLPIGRQSFPDILERGELYVDKTRYIYDLVKRGGVFFLSRPRRFGKSLLLSTLKEIFLGNKELFQGLWLYESDYAWKEYPIIHIDFSNQNSKTTEQLERFIVTQLDYVAARYGVKLEKTDYFSRFEELVFALNTKTQVVILIDEYDKPIIDHLEHPEKAKEMRDILKGFYTIIKANDAHIRFVFLTGVSKFSKAGVFSGLNNLNDISMDPKYSAILGLTEKEIIDYFANHLEDFAKSTNLSVEQLISKIRDWYNGYCFSGQCEKVYNPFSTLLLFDKKDFRNYWFETGTPSFLFGLMKGQNLELNSMPLRLQEYQFGTYDIENLEILPLLFQTGYLTMKAYDPDRMLYTLDYPNFEVKYSFLHYFARSYTKKFIEQSALYDLIDFLRENKMQEFFETLRSIFASIGYDLHIPMEKYYQTVFFLIFTLIGLRIQTEVKTNIGRIDVVIEDKDIYIFEFKFADSAENALAQIHKNRYYEKFLPEGRDERLFVPMRSIYLVGVEFRDRNVGEWKVEKL